MYHMQRSIQYTSQAHTADSQGNARSAREHFREEKQSIKTNKNRARFRL